MSNWRVDDSNVLELPSGRLVRGRVLRRSSSNEWTEVGPPEFELCLLGSRPPALKWPSRWVKWRDFGLPSDRVDAKDAFSELWGRATSERTSVTCDGGRGRTGTALACIAIIDGVPPSEAVEYVRHHYHPKAVETPWQKHFVKRFSGSLN